MIFKPTVQPCTRISLFFCISIDMVNGQKLNMAITTTGASRMAIAVVHQSSHAYPLLSLSILNAFGFRVIPKKLPASKYLATFAGVLKAFAVRATVITVKIMRVQRQPSGPAHDAHA